MLKITLFNNLLKIRQKIENEKMPKSQMKNRQKTKSCIKFILFDARLSYETILSTNNR